MTELPWDLVLALSTTGVFMALLSSLIGMRPKVENPLWWAVYAVWIAIVVIADRGAPFLTILALPNGTGALPREGTRPFRP